MHTRSVDYHQYRVGEWLDRINLYLACLVSFFIPISAAGNNIAFYIMLLFFLLSGNWQEKWQCVKTSRLSQAALLLWLLTFISILYSIATYHYALSMASKYDKLLFIPMLIYTLQSERDIKWCLNSFWAALVLTLALGYLYGFLPIHLQNLYFIINTPFIMHIETNMMMAIFACWLTYHCLRKGVTLKARISYGASALVTVYYVLAMSPARSGWVIFIALMIYLIYLFIRQGQWPKSILIILLSIAAFGVATHSPEFKTRVAEGHSDLQQYTKGNPDTSWGARISFYQHTLLLVKQRWLIGTGIGGFDVAYHQLVEEFPSAVPTANPHNQYLDTTSQLGILGVALLLWLYLSAWYCRNRLNEPQALIAQGICIAIMVGSLFNSWLMDLHAGFCFCLLATLGTWTEKNALLRVTVSDDFV
jgi:O-antigen ligase